MSTVPSNPYNLVACNITSLYGGYVTKETWKNSANRVLKPQSAKKRSSEMWTSCDESDHMSMVQKYDDDKLELTCYERWYSFLFFRQSRFGQVRSPFKIELKEIEEQKGSEQDLDSPAQDLNEAIGMTIDGEIYRVIGGKDVKVELDPDLPKIRVARRNPSFKDVNQIMMDLHHLSPPFV